MLLNVLVILSSESPFLVTAYAWQLIGTTIPGLMICSYRHCALSRSIWTCLLLLWLWLLWTITVRIWRRTIWTRGLWRWWRRRTTVIAWTRTAITAVIIRATVTTIVAGTAIITAVAAWTSTIIRTRSGRHCYQNQIRCVLMQAMEERPAISHLQGPQERLPLFLSST